MRAFISLTVVMFLVTIMVGCGGGGSSSGGGGDASIPAELLGNWSGSWTSSSGATGSLSIDVDVGSTESVSIGYNYEGSLCGGTAGGGRKPGTVSGNNITFTIRGSPEASDAVTFTGTYTSTSINGTYSGTGICTGTGTFSLTKI